jgi:hypothetical protein
MINRLAVILIGQYRTWPICSKYLIEFFKDKATKIDYFFVTWDTTSIYSNGVWTESTIEVTDEKITKFFDKDQTVICKVLPDIPEIHTYYRMAYLSLEANKLKKEFEINNNFIYDQVVETRPDMYLRSYPWGGLEYKWPLCNDYEYNGGEISNIGHRDLFMPDCYIRTNSPTHDILSQRINDFDVSNAYKKKILNHQYRHGHHAMLAKFLLIRNIKKINCRYPDYIFDTVIRSTEMDNINLDDLSLDEIVNLNTRFY